MACYPLEMAPKTVAGPSETISGRSAKTGFRTLEKVNVRRLTALDVVYLRAEYTK
jgi:hypothetical protein